MLYAQFKFQVVIADVLFRIELGGGGGGVLPTFDFDFEQNKFIESLTYELSK